MSLQRLWGIGHRFGSLQHRWGISHFRAFNVSEQSATDVRAVNVSGQFGSVFPEESLLRQSRVTRPNSFLTLVAFSTDSYRPRMTTVFRAWPWSLSKDYTIGPATLEQRRGERRLGTRVRWFKRCPVLLYSFSQSVIMTCLLALKPCVGNIDGTARSNNLSK